MLICQCNNCYCQKAFKQVNLYYKTKIKLKQIDYDYKTI